MKMYRFFNNLLPSIGLEPILRKESDFKSYVSTYFTKKALWYITILYIKQYLLYFSCQFL